MPRYPAATWRPLNSSYLPDADLDLHYRVNLHTQAGLGSLHGYFNQPGRPSSHFWIGQNGAVEQYVDTDRQAEADLDGNDATISIETEGGHTNAQGEKWTEAQLRAIVALVDWLLDTHDIQRDLCTNSFLDSSSSKGLSWHRLGIDGNFPALPDVRAGRQQRGGGMHYSTSFGKVCPGDNKIRQIHDVIAPYLFEGEPIPPQPEPPEHETLAIDGQWGPATTRRLQEVFGTPVDGVISHQWKQPGINHPGLYAAQWDSTGDGSLLIKAIQKLVGAAQDGLCGKETITKMQQYLDTPVDGKISTPESAMVKEMQRRLNARAD